MATLSRDDARASALRTLKRLELVIATRQMKLPRGSKEWDACWEDLLRIRQVAYLLANEEEAP
jgi:hypothetical protein